MESSTNDVYENRTVTDVNGRTYYLRVKLANRKNYKALLALENSSDYMNLVTQDWFDADTFEEAVNQAGIQISKACPPNGALSVDGIMNLPDKELIKRINEVAACPKKIIYMFAHGYAFRWELFKNVAQTKGFINTSGSKQKPVYKLPPAQDCKDGKKSDGVQQERNQTLDTKKPVRQIEIHSFDLMDEEYPKEIRNMLSVQAREDLNYITDGLTKKESGRVVGKLLEMYFEELKKMKDAGKLEIYGTKIEKIRKEHKI